MLKRLKAWARRLKTQTLVVFLAARDPRTPLLAKVVALGITVYALSPLDLIPDFIPVIGYLDDLVLVPVGLWLALRMIPKAVLSDAEGKLRSAESLSPRVRFFGAVGVVVIWLALLGLTAWLLFR